MGGHRAVMEERDQRALDDNADYKHDDTESDNDSEPEEPAVVRVPGGGRPPRTGGLILGQHRPSGSSSTEGKSCARGRLGCCREHSTRPKESKDLSQEKASMTPRTPDQTITPINELVRQAVANLQLILMCFL